MNNKGNISNQTRHLTLRIANIKFSILHRTDRKKSSTSAFLQNANDIQPPQIDQARSKERVLSRNSFIPSTSIKSQMQVERTRQFVNTPLFPADVTYSKFPMRRPKSIKPRTYFPVFRERISSVVPQRGLNLSQQSMASVPRQEQIMRKGSRPMHSRAATKSCLVLNQREKEQHQTFVRYSHINSIEDCSDLKENADTKDQKQQINKTCA